VAYIQTTVSMDIAIAACALERGARLWTLNPDDFRDLPGLELYTPA
jgi:predicted nucleic acid-binding protein